MDNKTQNKNSDLKNQNTETQIKNNETFKITGNWDDQAEQLREKFPQLTDSDHSGSDCDNDNTEKGKNTGSENKFDKPKREVDPDTTGRDIHSDKTKK